MPSDGSSYKSYLLELIPRLWYGTIVQIDGDTYLVGYSGDGSDGYLKTLSIAPMAIRCQL